ncbi:MAG: DUF3575 domain-containing protein [Bacteroidales bacterium]
MKKIIFLILLIFFCNCLLAQDTTTTKVKRKNAVKGIITYFPVLFNSIISLGYERYITSNSSLCLTLKGYYFLNDGGERYSYSIIPNYNYYFSSKYKFINNICLNPCLIYTYASSGGDDYQYITNNYGLGFTIGKRIYISHKKRWFFDIGFGTAYFNKIYKFYEERIVDEKWNPVTMHYDIMVTTITSHNPTYPWYPRFIFLLGYKF